MSAISRAQISDVDIQGYCNRKEITIEGVSLTFDYSIIERVNDEFLELFLHYAPFASRFKDIETWQLERLPHIGSKSIELVTECCPRLLAASYRVLALPSCCNFTLLVGGKKINIHKEFMAKQCAYLQEILQDCHTTDEVRLELPVEMGAMRQARDALIGIYAIEEESSSAPLVTLLKTAALLKAPSLQSRCDQQLARHISEMISQFQSNKSLKNRELFGMIQKEICNQFQNCLPTMRSSFKEALCSILNHTFALPGSSSAHIVSGLSLIRQMLEIAKMFAIELPKESWRKIETPFTKGVWSDTLFIDQAVTEEYTRLCESAFDQFKFTSDRSWLGDDTALWLAGLYRWGFEPDRETKAKKFLEEKLKALPVKGLPVKRLPESYAADETRYWMTLYLADLLFTGGPEVRDRKQAEKVILQVSKDGHAEEQRPEFLCAFVYMILKMSSDQVKQGSVKNALRLVPNNYYGKMLLRLENKEDPTDHSLENISACIEGFVYFPRECFSSEIDKNIKKHLNLLRCTPFAIAYTKELFDRDELVQTGLRPCSQDPTYPMVSVLVQLLDSVK